MALNDEQVQKIRLLLSSSGWNDVMRPVIARRAQDAVKALVLTPAERTGEYQSQEDAEIRAGIRAYEWMLSCWPNEVAVFDLNRRQEELQRQDNGANPQ